jgi:disulfide bond formation protein DsbB
MKSASLPVFDFHKPPVAAAAWIIAAVGAATIVGAWFFQYVIGLVPCPLCLDQRVPYYVAIPAALALAFLARDPRRHRLALLLLLAIAALLAYGAGLGVYHAGIEWKWWPGPATCTSAGGAAGGGSLLSQMQAARVVPCDEAQWRFLGLSLAGYNALISGALALFAFMVALRDARR